MAYTLPSLTGTQISGAQERLKRGLSPCQMMAFPSPSLLLLVMEVQQAIDGYGGHDEEFVYVGLEALAYYTAFYSHQKSVPSELVRILDGLVTHQPRDRNWSQEMETRLVTHCDWPHTTFPASWRSRMNQLDLHIRDWVQKVGGTKTEIITSLMELYNCPTKGTWAKYAGLHLWRGLTRSDGQIQTQYRPTGRVFDTFDEARVALGASQSNTNYLYSDSQDVMVYMRNSHPMKFVEVTCVYKSRYPIQSWSSNDLIAWKFAVSKVARPTVGALATGTFSASRRVLWPTSMPYFSVVLYDRVNPQQTLFNPTLFGLLDDSLEEEQEVIRVSTEPKRLRGIVAVTDLGWWGQTSPEFRARPAYALHDNSPFKSPEERDTYFTELFNASVASQLFSKA